MCHARCNVQSFLLSVDFLQILPSFCGGLVPIRVELVTLFADLLIDCWAFF